MAVYTPKTWQGRTFIKASDMNHLEQGVAANNADIVALTSKLNTNTEASTTATVTHALGSYFSYNDILYKATTNIAIGDTITPNTNCVATTITAELTALFNNINSIVDGNEVNF